eukprot:m.220425 g.220425  ORF g.220425 m.220425 type:complete len:145 (+) comp39939_c0_seq8:359-793(+)
MHHSVDFLVGSLVLVHQKARKVGLSPKLQMKFDGPYSVLEKMSPVTYRLQHLEKGKKSVVHVQRMIPFRARKTADNQEEGQNESGSDSDLDSEDEEVAGELRKDDVNYVVPEELETISKRRVVIVRPKRQFAGRPSKRYEGDDF